MGLRERSDVRARLTNVMRRPGTASLRGQLSDDAGVLWRGPQRSEDTRPHQPRIPPGRRPRLTEYGKSSPALNRCLVGVYSPVSGYMSRVRCCTLAGIAGSHRRGEWIDPAPSKIFVGEWLRWHGQQVQLKASTLVRYDVAIRCQILPEWEGVPLSPVPTPTSGLARPVSATRIGCVTHRISKSLGGTRSRSRSS